MSMPNFSAEKSLFLARRNTYMNNNHNRSSTENGVIPQLPVTLGNDIPLQARQVHEMFFT